MKEIILDSWRKWSDEGYPRTHVSKVDPIAELGRVITELFKRWDRSHAFARHYAKALAEIMHAELVANGHTEVYWLAAGALGSYPEGHPPEELAESVKTRPRIGRIVIGGER